MLQQTKFTSNVYKDYFTTSVSEDKSFKNVKNFQTYFKDEKTGKWIPKFRNTHTFAINNNWGQIGNGTNHKVRGSFVVDCDYPYTADYLLNLFRRYFVEPTTILRNPESNHCQVHFFFTKDVVVYKGYTPLKRQKKFMEYARKLNGWMKLGDVKWTGYWMKNPFSDKWVKEFDSMNEYSFEELCEYIDILVSREEIEERNWNEYTEIDVSTLAEIALGNEVHDPFVDEYGVRHVYRRFDKVYRDPTDKEKVKYEKEDIAEEKVADKRVKEEKRGKFKKGSENRHSTLFNIMKVNISTYGYDNEYVMKLALVYNTFFDKPLSEKELNAEVFNESTLKKTFGNLRNWRQKNKENKMNEAEIMSEIEKGDFYELSTRFPSLHTQLRLVKEYWPDIDYSDLEKKYKKEYLGKYEGKYEGTKEYDKIRTKVKDWVKHHNINDNKPKKWGKIEFEILEKLQ